jgi:hypothetical protein
MVSATQSVGLASGANFPDALAAAPMLGTGGEPLLLTDPASLPAAVRSYLVSAGITQLHVFGGPDAVAFGPKLSTARGEQRSEAPIGPAPTQSRGGRRLGPTPVPAGPAPPGRRAIHHDHRTAAARIRPLGTSQPARRLGRDGRPTLTR